MNTDVYAQIIKNFYKKDLTFEISQIKKEQRQYSLQTLSIETLRKYADSQIVTLENKITNKKNLIKQKNKVEQTYQYEKRCREMAWRDHIKYLENTLSKCDLYKEVCNLHLVCKSFNEITNKIEEQINLIFVGYYEFSNIPFYQLKTPHPRECNDRTCHFDQYKKYGGWHNHCVEYVKIYYLIDMQDIQKIYDHMNLISSCKQVIIVMNLRQYKSFIFPFKYFQ
jgi:hypothetical protein